MTRAIVTAFTLLLCGCLLDTVGQDRECESLVEELSQCIQVDLVPSDCNAISSTDVRALKSALDASGCEFLQDALPGDGDLRSSSCRLYGQGCLPSVQPAPLDVPSRFPILLVNGVDVSPLFRWSQRIQDTLRSQGHEVHLATLPPYSSVETRTRVLSERVAEVRQRSGVEKVNLICHSFGGLDCRYLVSPAGLARELGQPGDTYTRQVASVTTVGTAHRGTPIADASLGLLPGVSEGDASRALATWIGDWFGPEQLEADAELRASLTALSETQAPVFNAEIVDPPDLFLQSWAGFSAEGGEALPSDAGLTEVCAPDFGAMPFSEWNGVMDFMAMPLVMGAEIVGETAKGPHDGLCPVSSARWGLFRGCIPADHMEQLGQQRLPDVNVRTGFDMGRFYALVAADLALRGF